MADLFAAVKTAVIVKGGAKTKRGKKEAHGLEPLFFSLAIYTFGFD